MYLRKSGLVLVFAFILTACATRVENIKQDVQTNQLAVGQGYLMMTIETNTDMRSIEIDGQQAIQVGQEDVRKGSNHILVALPAGEYYFSQVTAHNLFGTSRFDLEDDKDQDWGFKVEANTISYVGLFRVENSNWGYYSSFILINQSSQALEYLEENFPLLLNNHQIAYQGPGEDDFFEVIRTTPHLHNKGAQQ